MCRSGSNYEQFKNVKDHVQIKGFCLRLSLSNRESLVPETLTLVYLPRNRGTLLEINGSQVRSSSGAFMALHRRKSPENEAVFTSTDFVRVSDEAYFEIYIRDEKIVSGSFRREGNGWRMEFRCGLQELRGFGVLSAEICVAGGGGLMVKEKVEMYLRRKRRVFVGMETIPEEIELSLDYEEVICSGNCEERDEKKDWFVEMEMQEGLMKWVDLGIYAGAALCLGIGFLGYAVVASNCLRRVGF